MVGERWLSERSGSGGTPMVPSQGKGLRGLIAAGLLSALWVLSTPLCSRAAPVAFTVQSVQNGGWSDPKTWSAQRLPKAGDYVQIRPGHQVTYDVHSDEAIRLLHVSG